MNTTFDLAPLRRSGIGFDHLFEMLGQAMNTENTAKYPPYDIERTGEDAYRLTLALAGWSPNEITVTAEPNLLVISGEKAEPKGTQYLYRGIPSVTFEQRFNLADHAGSRCADDRWPVGDRSRARIARGFEAASYREREQQRAAGVGAKAGCVSLQAP